MRASKISPNGGNTIPARHASKGCLAAALVVLIGISVDLAIGQAQAPASDVPGAQVLTRGPVHEAFAGIVTHKQTNKQQNETKHYEKPIYENLPASESVGLGPLR
jgi:hypothetical protein